MIEDKDEATGPGAGATTMAGGSGGDGRTARRGRRRSRRRSGSPRSKPSWPRPRTGCCARWPRPRTCAAAPQRERDDAQKYAVGDFAKDLLSPADNLRRALDALPEAEAEPDARRACCDGVAATERELLAAFERHGLKRIDPKGERFDHNFHQAIFEAERPGRPAGTVVEVLQPGYVLHDRLLRPAMVGVAKAGSPPPRTRPRTRNPKPPLPYRGGMGFAAGRYPIKRGISGGTATA